MLRSKWLYVAGLGITAPVVLVLCWAAFDQLLSSDVTVHWGSGGKLPPSASASTDIYLIALIAAVVWLGGLARIIGMFRAEQSGE